MAYINFKPSDYFATKLYTANGSTNAITGVGFQPNFTWIKKRSSTSAHYFFDSLRTTYSVSSNTTAAQTDQSGQGFTSLDSDGFTLSGTGSGGGVNDGTNTFASWNWKAGTTSGISGGTITPSSYSINTTSKFGIYKYTGTGANATIAHGLSSAPAMVIIKKTSGTDNWACYHSALAATQVLMLDTAGASQTMADRFNSTAPTSTLFSIGTAGAVNASGGTYIAYCFAGVKGFSKFGAFHGNGQTGASAPFIYTGFKPAFVMIKSTASGSWLLFDSKRASTSNIPEGSTGVPSYLEPNNTGTEQGDNPIFLYSNGFQCLDTLTNGDGVKFIYMAFAENPIVGSNGTAGVAR